MGHIGGHAGIGDDAGLDVHAVEVEVLVTGVVLHEQQLLAVARPEVAGDGAVLGVGDGLGRVA